MRPLLLLALLSTATAAKTFSPLSSRCIKIESPEACPVLAVAASDRWAQSSPGSAGVSFAVGCGYTVPDDYGSHLLVENLCDADGGPTSTPFGVNVPEPVGTSTGRHQLFTNVLFVSGFEPGTVTMNVSLIDGRTHATVAWMLMCFEATLPVEEVGPPSLVPQAAVDTLAPAWGRPYVPDFSAERAYPADSTTPKGVTSKRPIRVAILGDVAGQFDGMKRFLYTNLAYTPKSEVVMTYLDLTANPPNATGVMGRLLEAAGVQVIKLQLSCPLTVCASTEAFYRMVAAAPYQPLSPGLLEAFGDLMAVLANQDAVWMVSEGRVTGAGKMEETCKGLCMRVSIGFRMAPCDVCVCACVCQVNDVPTDYYVMDLARVANPNVVRIADLTTRFRLQHRDSYSDGRPPFDAMFAPSQFVATHAAVQAEHLPAYVTPGVVDTALFNPDKVAPAPFCANLRKQGGPVFGFIARLSPEKGPGMFIQAASIVVRTLPTARFFMIGRPLSKSFLASMTALRSGLGLTDVVRGTRRPPCVTEYR